MRSSDLDLDAIQQSMATDRSLPSGTRTEIATMSGAEFRHLWETMNNIARMPADRAAALGRLAARYNAGDELAANVLRKAVRGERKISSV